MAGSREPDWVCRNCGYDLAGRADSFSREPCPECGATRGGTMLYPWPAWWVMPLSLVAPLARFIPPGRWLGWPRTRPNVPP